MDSLKLLALDTEDLAVVSAHLQDAVFKTDGLAYDARHHVFSVVVNRFVWEKAARARGKSFERRRAAIAFKRVNAVRSIGIDRKDKDAVLSLLAINFTPNGEGPDGTLELVLSGSASIALDVECVEVQLADTGGAWETSLKPRHPAV
ncbi:DUF2948 family protein [Shinella sumterensis]|uniref:DUF2948 family protein n=1 Tax=Shinella oryzae TaxID=2871820 RepID=A0ABY9K6M6_9HYPH|nr:MULTISPECIES: DUF2948 family protein [Shinella]MDP9590322.1 hypothetical protein [Shinella zoogloeoides]MCD1266684.1 DUF2948 family protein [Shinella sumterensis]TFE96678.1 hypothetical protein B5M44_19025 [Shinella sumterensis]WLS04225.1 DUF2948 family protein [Shinella oryzae]WLS09747.1 DUF2948 family protein [Shinella sumterensis]